MALILCGAGALGLFVAGLGAAQDRQNQSFAGPPSFADVVEQVNPAVVTVAVTMDAVAWQTATGSAPFAGTPFEDFFGNFGFSDPRQMPQMPQPRQGEGSGFIIDPAGYIATNNHVVEGATAVTVTLSTGEELPATVVGTDPRTDLALIKIENGRNLPALRFGDSNRARIGDWVLAIGNPFGLGGTATAGIISARSRDIHSGPYDDYLQIDAAINSGNSGGPVFNAAGEVIGINTAIFSPTGGSVGIGFAIPSNLAHNVLDELREDGAVSRGWLGVGIEAVEKGASGGARITSVQPNGPAEAAGLVSGDIVTRFNGEAIDSPKALSWLVGSLDAGDRVAIEVLRDGDRRELKAELGTLDEAQLQAAVPAAPGPRMQPNFRR
jgi:serine protease Do